MRTIDRLRYEFGVPIEYEETQRGYYLTHDDFSFAVPPATRDELLALSFASGFISIVEGPSVRAAMDSLWNRLLHARPEFERDKVSEKFSISGQISTRMGGVDLIRLVLMCCQGNLVCVTYRSPWLSVKETHYRGHFERVHCANGLFFAKFMCCNGDALVFNLSFITMIEPLRDQVQSRSGLEKTLRFDEGWYSGHGSWSGAVPERIEVAIRAPGRLTMLSKSGTGTNSIGGMVVRLYEVFQVLFRSN
jgi:hypothetical protein